MNDDQMDELLIQGARDYNEPNAVPREEMWARIAEARRAATAPKVAPRNTWRWVSIAAAAAIVLALGITIGRRLEREAPAGTQNIAKAPATPDSHTAVAKNDTPTASKNDTVIPQLRDETRKTDRRVRELATTEPAPTSRGNADPNLAYRLVMLRHIAGSEAMITAFRASARRGEVDKQIADWARELLSTTRMLEASPVNEDPTMKRLLDDLDLVLMQIAQYTTRGTVNSEELDLIEESINKRGVIAKLRSTLPVRHNPAGT
jgi:hypothetical protein